MVSLRRRHFVPNPVAIDSTGFQANRRTSLFIHTRYDEVYRLIGTDRGHFDQYGQFVGDDYQTWTLDGLGNWSGFDDDGTLQTRDTNAANEIQSISAGVTPVYDKAGIMTTMPKPDVSTSASFTATGFSGYAVSAVPEPATWVMLAAGAAALALYPRRQRQ